MRMCVLVPMHLMIRPCLRLHVSVSVSLVVFLCVLSNQVSPEAKDLMRKLLTREPTERLGGVKGASEIRAHPWFASINWPLLRNTVSDGWFCE